MFNPVQVSLLLLLGEPVLARLTQFRLELLGYDVRARETGAEAIEAIERKMPGIVIVDTTISDGDGLEWIANLRTRFSSDEIAVIVFSLDPSLETVERAHFAGAQDYLITPFDPTVMEEKIEQLATKRLAAPQTNS